MICVVFAQVTLFSEPNRVSILRCSNLVGLIEKSVAAELNAWLAKNGANISRLDLTVAGAAITIFVVPIITLLMPFGTFRPI